MRIYRFILCLIIGHNKILSSDEKYLRYHSECTQCGKKWNNKQLSKKCAQFSSQKITLVGGGKIVMIGQKQTELKAKKRNYNFYVL